MEACASIEQHVDRLLNRYTQYVDAYCTSLDSLLRQVETLERELLAGLQQQDTDAEPSSSLSVAAVLIFEQFLKKCREVLQQITTGHRELHPSVSKCGREIDKKFVSSLEEVCMRKIIYEKNHQLRKHIDLLIAKHYLANGLVDIADDMLQLSGTQCDENNKNKFIDMYSIVEALQSRDIGPAMDWCTANRDRLDQMKSNLEFYLCRLQFIQLLKRGQSSREEVMAYAKTFHRFAKKNTKEMQALMASMVFMNVGLENSPYRHLLSDSMWDQAIAAFTSDWCKLYKIPTNSPLSIIMEAGTKAVTALLNLRKVMRQGKIADVLGLADELPVEVELLGFPQYHSVFACPILRQPTTEQNPPIRLVCGHVISKEAVSRLVSHDRLKCPYCPQESHVSRTKVIHF